MLHVSLLLLICLFAYTFFYIVVCLIGCFCCNLQHSKTPWENVDKVIEKLQDQQIRSDFLEKLDTLHYKNKHGSFNELCLKLADLVVDSAN